MSEQFVLISAALPPSTPRVVGAAPARDAPARDTPGGERNTMRHVRRRWAAAVTAPLTLAGTLAAGIAAAAPAAAVGPDRLPITVGNSSGRSEQVYLYVLGTNLVTGRLGWVDGSGAFTPWPAGSNPPSPAPDTAIAGPRDGGSTTVRVPRGFSGRIYFSFGQKLPFSLTPDGLVQPAPWAGGDPTRDILFDWSELTYNDSGLWLNSSQVDMFAVPHSVSVTGASGRTAPAGSSPTAVPPSSTRCAPAPSGPAASSPAPTAPCCASSPPARPPPPGC